MKFLTISILLLAFPGLVQAGEKVDKTLDVSATADVRIEDPHGQIEIHSWNKNRVKVSGEISDQAKGYTFEKQGNKVVFEVEYDHETGWSEHLKGRDSSKLKFYVPVKSHMDVSNINGDIRLTGVEGGTVVESINGNIEAEKLKQRISLETINGGITTSNIDGRIDIETINGNINDRKSSGELNISSVQGNVISESSYSSVDIEIVNGDLELQLDKLDELSIDSVNGRIDTSMHLNKNGNVAVTNVNGRINLLFNKDVSADFEINTFVGGDIINKLTNDKAEKQKFVPGRTMHFSKDGGSGRVSIDTVSGKIRIGAR